MAAEITSSEGRNFQHYGAIVHADRVAAETLIRSSVLALANGAPIGDIDEVIRRNSSNVSHADVQAGRLNTNVLGDIINTVEQAKGSKPFNWNAATPEQIKAYMTANGIKFRDHGPLGLSLLGGDKDSSINNSGGSSQKYDAMPGSNSAIYKSLGLSDTTGNALAAMGFTSQAQIRQIANDANTIGLAPNNAALDLGRLRKAEGNRTDQHVNTLKRYHDELDKIEADKREAQKITDERQRAEQLKKIEERRAAAEKSQEAYEKENVRTPEGKKAFKSLRDKIREDAAHHVRARHVQAATHDTSQQQKAADNTAIGVDKQRHDQHKKVVAQATPQKTAEIGDAFLAMADDKKPDTPATKAAEAKLAPAATSEPTAKTQQKPVKTARAPAGPPAG